MHKVGNEKEQEILTQLREEGKTVYSFSRISTYNNCQWEYYNSYVKRDRGKGNVYTEMGSEVHDIIENIYRGTIEDKFDFAQAIHNKAFELEVIGMDFPNEVIKNSFMGDMIHFANNFKRLDGDFTLEKMFVTKLDDNKYLHGYIDAIQNVDEQNNIIDWKTSSKFAGSKLVKAGRQLIIYKIGLEETSGMQISSVMWNMLKYMYICHTQANGKIKKRMINRSKLIKEMSKAFEKDMIKGGMNEFDVLITLDNAKSLSDFPECITDKYWTEDCLLEYDVTEDKIQEVKDYIINTIDEIEAKNKDDEFEWKPLNIGEESFYCNTLCNHRLTCRYFEEFKQENPYKKIGF